MKYVCPDCGVESVNSGNCPSCETPLLKRADANTPGGVEDTERDSEGVGEVGDGLEEDEDEEEDLW